MEKVEIRIKGHLDDAWDEWFEGFTITHLEENQTLLSGDIPDQSALYGLIAKLRDLGAQLISVNYGCGKIGDHLGL
jgi:hypothetical protein